MKRIRIVATAVMLLTLLGLSAESYALSNDVLLTKIINHVKDIAAYVNVHGYVNENKNKVIDYPYEEGTNCLLEYNGDTLNFTLYHDYNDNNDDTTAYVNMYCNMPFSETLTVKMALFGEDDTWVVAEATFDPCNYVAGTKSLYFVMEKGNLTNAYTQEVCNQMFDYSFYAWNDMLYNRMGHEIVNLGFVKMCLHTWNSGAVMNKATTNAKGEIWYICSSCGKLKTKDIPLVKKIKVSAKTISGKYSALKKKSQTVKAKKVFRVSNAPRKVTYKKKSGTSKVSVSKTGNITLKKGIKKGTYKVKVKVTEAANRLYSSTSKTVTIKIQVK